MTTLSKIAERHLSRDACIYIRQSTPGQVRFNQESTERQYNLKSKAELHIIRASLHGGKVNKAAKGELRFPLPVGLVFDGEGIVLDPDQEVQGAVRTVFELFEREGTAYGVVQRFQELGLRFPRRSYGGAWDGELLWGRIPHSRALV